LQVADNAPQTVAATFYCMHLLALERKRKYLDDMRYQCYVLAHCV
jgi:hypothetical protein